MDEFARVGFIVSPGFPFKTLLDGLLDLGQAFKTKLEGLEALVNAVPGYKFLQPCPLEDAIDRWS